MQTLLLQPSLSQLLMPVLLLHATSLDSSHNSPVPHDKDGTMMLSLINLTLPKVMMT